MGGLSTEVIAECEALLGVADELALAHLRSLVEWRLRAIIENETVVAIAEVTLGLGLGLGLELGLGFGFGMWVRVRVGVGVRVRDRDRRRYCGGDPIILTLKPVDPQPQLQPEPDAELRQQL